VHGKARRGDSRRSLGRGVKTVSGTMKCQMWLGFDHGKVKEKNTVQKTNYVGPLLADSENGGD